MDSKERHFLLPWDRLAKALDPQPGLQFADLGAGTGTMLRQLLIATHGEGTYWAVEIQEEMRRLFREKLETWEEEDVPGVSGIRVVAGSPNSIPLQSNLIDRALLIHLIHEIEKPELFLKELRRCMSPWSRAVVVDWNTPLDTEAPPASGPPMWSRVSALQGETWALAAGFRTVEKIPGFPLAWGLLLRP